MFAQSFLFIGLGMTFSVATIVICDLYQNPSSDFVISLNEAAWYGKCVDSLYLTILNTIKLRSGSENLFFFNVVTVV